MENRYIITLSSSDKLIVAWKNKTLAAGQEKMSILVKKAILTFIEKGEFLDIGHIHFDPNTVEVKKGEVIPLHTARTPIISRWIEENRAAGLDVSGPVKLLLTKCIHIVPSTEAEYFPPPQNSHKYIETNIMNLMKANAAKITEQSVTQSISEPASQPTQKEQPATIDTAQETVVHSSKSHEAVPKISDSVVNIPGNDSVISGLNSLLPQRAIKKT